MLGTTEILIIGGVVVLLFGAAAIPRLAKSLGQAKKEFQKGLDGQADEKEPNDKKPDNGE